MFKSKIQLVYIFLFLISIKIVTARPPMSVVAIADVTIIPMNSKEVLTNQTILIENGKIKQFGKVTDIEIPKGSRIIDGKGKYLLPGFFDMHAHFFYEQGNNKNTCESELKVMLANGLTTVRIECGDSIYLEERKNVNDQKMDWPTDVCFKPTVCRRLTGLGPEKYLRKYVKNLKMLLPQFVNVNKRDMTK